MSVQLTCPQCGQPVQGLNRYCLHCGVDLAVAMEHAENFFRDPDEIYTGKSLSPEILVPRIGEYFVEMGYVTHEQLMTALSHQNEQRDKKSNTILIGQALLDLGFIDRETLDQVVTIQILRLQNALELSNQQLFSRVQDRTRELQLALEKLSDLNQMKSNFMARLSHELRSPLTHIKGYLDLLIEGDLGSLEDKQLQTLQILRKSEEKLEKLIDDLLQFSKASRGEFHIFQKPVDIIAIIQHCLAESMEKAEKKAIILKADLLPYPVRVWADSEKISWAISHFLDNAIKFSEIGDQVSIEIDLTEKEFSIAVIDQGIGIPAEKICEIFEPFQQLENALTRRHGGTGLGLAMAQRIIDAHGSKIKVKSKPGFGSRFEFCLPLYFEDLHAKH